MNETLKEYGLGENNYEVGDEVVAVVDEFIAFHKEADSVVDNDSLNSLSHISKTLLLVTIFCGVVLIVIGNFPSISVVVLQPKYIIFYFLFLLFALISTVALIRVTGSGLVFCLSKENK